MATAIIKKLIEIFFVMPVSVPTLGFYILNYREEKFSKIIINFLYLLFLQ